VNGTLHPDFVPVADVLRSVLESYAGGAAACVFHRGECVVDLWGGTKNRAGDPWTRDTMAPSFSTTKGVASTILHVLRDRGLLDYDDRVVQHWPEFGQAGKSGITIRQIMSHQSGLYHIRQMIDHADRMMDWEHMIQAIEQTPPIHPPGARTGYHGLTYGFLVGEIARRVSGVPFPTLVRDELVIPLGLDGMYIGASDGALERAAELLWSRRGSMGGSPSLEARIGDALERGAAVVKRAMRALRIEVDPASILDALAPRGISTLDFSGHDFLRAPVPAANGLFTARSLARMYATLAAGGTLDGVRLLSRETLELATERQAEAAGRSVIPFDMRWRLGYHAVFTTRGVPSNGFGHFGFGGSGGWADPSRELAVGFIVNSGFGTPFGDLRTARISGAALASADRRDGRSPARAWIGRNTPEWIGCRSNAANAGGSAPRTTLGGFAATR
jgi:CubicO group peptidase (beta-lactamase class C family)